MNFKGFNEKELIERCKRGDATAFGMLYDQYIEQIYRFVYYKVMHKETAEDIVSDVFFKAFEKMQSYKNDGTFSAWLYTIARNRVIDFYRSRKYAINIEDVFDLPYDADFFAHADAKETLSKIAAYVKTLNPKQREIVLLRVWEDLSYAQIAEIVGGSEDSVKMAFSRAMKIIRDTFGPLAMVVLFLAKP